MEGSFEKEIKESLPAPVAARLGYGWAGSGPHGGPYHMEPWQCLVYTLRAEERLT